MKGLLEELFRAGLAAVHGGRAVEAELGARDPGGERWTVLACGKAACAMAAGARAVLGTRIRAGSATTPDGHVGESGELEVSEAAHPVPDARGARAAERALSVAHALGPADALLVLLSGGASALWPAPVAGISLEQKQQLTELLLRSGVDIGALNTVRKHLSAIKGGQLARAASPARVLTLAISDVAGDRADAIGSGPTAADPTTYADALEVLERAGVLPKLARAVRSQLEAGARGEHRETPKPGDPCFERCEYRLVATLDSALSAIESAAQELGLRVESLGRVLAGEARERAAELAERARDARARGIDLLLLGGEPTVTVRGDGTGGRAQELGLAFALEIEGDRDLLALFAGTDGSDGPTPAAGTVVDGETGARARAGGVEPRTGLERNDSHRVLAASGDLLVTGPTHTNVSDVGLILLRKRS